MQLMGDQGQTHRAQHGCEESPISNAERRRRRRWRGRGATTRTAKQAPTPANWHCFGVVLGQGQLALRVVRPTVGPVVVLGGGHLGGGTGDGDVEYGRAVCGSAIELSDLGWTAWNAQFTQGR